MKAFNKKIVFINIPHIFIEAERLRRKWDESVLCAVASGDTGTSIIIDAPDSLSPGVRKGMFLKNTDAENINIIKADYDYMKETNGMIAEYLRNFSIAVESTGFGEFYIDLTGTERLFGRPMDTCGKIIKGLREMHGFNAAIGTAGNKLASHMASRIAEKNSVYEIVKSSEPLFIKPLSINHLPGIPDEVKRDITGNYNLRIIRELENFSRKDLNALFRNYGNILYEYSRNISPDYVTEKKKEKVLSRTIVLSDKANDDRVIRRNFFHLIIELCTDMRKEDIFPMNFSLRITYKDDFIYKKSKAIINPSFIEKEIYDFLLPYLNEAIVRRISLKKIKLTFSDFVPAAIQGNLFHENSDLHLSLAFDSIRERFGKQAIYFAG